MAGRAGHEGWREPPGWKGPSGFSGAPARKHGLRGQKTPLVARRKALRIRLMRTHKDGCASRRATPSMFEGRKEKTGVPGASTNNTADDSCALARNTPWIILESPAHCQCIERQRSNCHLDGRHLSNIKRAADTVQSRGCTPPAKHARSHARRAYGSELRISPKDIT